MSEKAYVISVHLASGSFDIKTEWHVLCLPEVLVNNALQKAMKAY